MMSMSHEDKIYQHLQSNFYKWNISIQSTVELNIFVTSLKSNNFLKAFLHFHM